MSEETTNSNPQEKSSLPAIIAGILVIVAGFLVYNYFVNTGEKEEQISFESAQVESESDGNIDSPAKSPASAVLSQQTITPSQLTTEEIASWVPRFITEDEVETSTYTVTKGDTLWNIALAKYGSGEEWTQILEANEGKIEFLPNGTQARIEIGTVLVLP